MRRHFISLLVLVCVGCAGNSVESGQATRPQTPEQDLPPEKSGEPTHPDQCLSHADCVLLDAGCGMAEVTTIQNKMETLKRLRQKDACKGDIGPQPHAVGCVKNKCVMWPVGNESIREGCKTASDCSVIEGSCWSRMVIHSKHKKAAKAFVKKQWEISDCAEPTEAVPEPTVRCDLGFCVPALPPSFPD